MKQKISAIASLLAPEDIFFFLGLFLVVLGVASIDLVYGAVTLGAVLMLYVRPLVRWIK